MLRLLEVTPAEIKIAEHSSLRTKPVRFDELPQGGNKTRVLYEASGFEGEDVQTFSRVMQGIAPAFKGNKLTNEQAEKIGTGLAGIVGILVDGKVDPEDLQNIEDFLYKSAPDSVKRFVRMIVRAIT